MRIPVLRKGPVCEFDRTVTPMVDVVFQLLVFFVLASGGRVAERSLSALLPAGNVSAAGLAPSVAKSSDLWIHLARTAGTKERTKSTRIEFEGATCRDAVELASALGRMAGNASDRRVILDVGGDVPVGDVIGVYDACRAAKYHSINFAATPEEAGLEVPSKMTSKTGARGHLPIKGASLPAASAL